MIITKLNEARVIQNGFVVMCDAQDDSRMYTNNDPFLYYDDSQETWTDIYNATVVENEKDLYVLLKMAKSDSSTKEYKVPFPAKFNVSIGPLDSDEFDKIVLKIRRQEALDKLTDEDKRILGLIG